MVKKLYGGMAYIKYLLFIINLIFLTHFSNADFASLKITDPSEDFVSLSEIKFRTYSLRWTIKDYDILSKSVKLFKSTEFPEGEEETRKWYIEFKPVNITANSDEVLEIYVKRTFKGDAFIEDMCRLENESKRGINFPNLKQLLTSDAFTIKVRAQRIYEQFHWNRTLDRSLIIIYKIRVFDYTQPMPQHFYRETSSKFFEPSDLSEDMSKLLNNEQGFQDVTISVQGKEFIAHRNILAARSQVFAAMFRSENYNSLVEIADLKPEVFEKIIHFIYTDKVDISDLNEFAPELVAAAERFNLKKLKEMVIAAMNENMSVENVLKTLEVSDIYSISSLKKQALKFLMSNLRAVKRQYEYKVLFAQRPYLMREFIDILDRIPDKVPEETQTRKP